MLAAATSGCRMAATVKTERILEKAAIAHQAANQAKDVPKSIQKNTWLGCAILLEKGGLKPSPRESPTKVRFSVTGSGFGTAAAVAEDGYFLTAAHCVEEGTRLICFNQMEEPDEKNFPFVEVPIRVVWSSAAPQGTETPWTALDLALIHAPVRVRPFPLAKELPTCTERLWATGLSPARFAGQGMPAFCWQTELLQTKYQPGNPGYSSLMLSGCWAAGDSGGPILNQQGQLVGTAFAGNLGGFALQNGLTLGSPTGNGFACQVSPDWIQNKISADRQRQRQRK